MNSSSRSPRLQLAALVTGLVLCLALANLLAAHWTNTENADTGPATPGFERREEVRELPREPADLPAPDPRPALLLMGNSHTYALPGLEKGQPLRPDAGATLIDELAAGVEALEPETDAVFYRLAYPNFLPFEMLTRYAQLSLAGYRPRIVVLGITWRNVARDRRLRYQIHTAFEDDAFARSFLARLEDPAVSADPRVLAAVEAEVRQVERDREIDRQQSSADRLDARLTEDLGRHVALLGQSAEVRSRVYRELAYAIDTWVVPEQTEGYSYDLIEDDLELNLACLRALLRWLAEDGARVLLYRAPERSDLAPLLDPRRQDEVLGELEAEARELGFLTTDAGRAVPDEYWGWERDTPDRSHFTEPGHRLLARQLLEAGAARNLWSTLREPRVDALQ